MSKDEAMGRLVRLAERCDEPSIVRLCDEFEESIEIGPYGVCTWSHAQLVSIAGPAEDERAMGGEARACPSIPAALSSVEAASSARSGFLRESVPHDADVLDATGFEAAEPAFDPNAPDPTAWEVVAACSSA